MWNFPRAWTSPEEYDNLPRRVQQLAAKFGKLAQDAEVVGNDTNTGPVVRVTYASHIHADEAVASLNGLDNRTNKQKRSGLPPILSLDLFVARRQIPGGASADRCTTHKGGLSVSDIGQWLRDKGMPSLVPLCKENLWNEVQLSFLTAEKIIAIEDSQQPQEPAFGSMLPELINFARYVGNRGYWVPPSEVVPISVSVQPCSESADNSAKVTTASGKEKVVRKPTKLPSEMPKRISEKEWSAWQERADLFQTRGVVSKPDLTFQEFFRERNRCRDRSYVSNSFLLRIGFFCNNDRMLDETTGQIERSLQDLSREQKILAVLLSRFSGSPREEEKPGKSGAAVVAKHIRQDSPVDFAAFVKQMPFSGRHTYRATLSRNELAIIAPEVARRIAAQTESRSLDTLTKQIITIIKEVGHEYQIDLESMRQAHGKVADNTQRCVAFHGLQVALDLEGFQITSISDSGNSCPLATGSRSGLTHVKRWRDPNATIEKLAAELGVPARHVQTALCEYNKYVKWFSGVDKIRPR